MAVWLRSGCDAGPYAIKVQYLIIKWNYSLSSFINWLAFSPTHTHDSIILVHVKVKDFLQFYEEPFHSARITLKMHFLVHYPRLIKTFGPLPYVLGSEIRRGTCQPRAKGSAKKKFKKHVWLLQSSIKGFNFPWILYSHIQWDSELLLLSLLRRKYIKFEGFPLSIAMLTVGKCGKFFFRWLCETRFKSSKR